MNEAAGGFIGFGIFAMIGWLLALPIVIFLNRVNKQNLRWLLVIGTAIGPCVFLIIDVLSLLNGTPQSAMDWQSPVMLVFAGLIGFVTTGIYVAAQFRPPSAS